MQIVFPAALAVSLTVLVGTPGRADPYRWCAEYGGGRGGGTNCYFCHLGAVQCRRIGRWRLLPAERFL